MLYIACVVYNKRIEDISSLSQYMDMLKRHDDVKIILLDNTTQREIINHNISFKGDSSIEYIINGENIGLSRAYNRVLDLIKSEDWVFWADDDTYFSIEYLENVYTATKCDVLIVSGIVKTNINTILSPIKRTHKVNTVIVAGKKHDNLYCINSGLCVRKSVYNVIGKYDEGFFLDMIDYWLFDELNKRSLDQILIVAGDISQSFSGTSKTTLVSKLRRFKIYAHDFNHYCTVEKRPLFYRIGILIKRFARIILESIVGII